MLDNYLYKISVKFHRGQWVSILVPDAPTWHGTGETLVANGNIDFSWKSQCTNEIQLFISLLTQWDQDSYGMAKEAAKPRNKACEILAIDNIYIINYSSGIETFLGGLLMPGW